MCLSDIIYTVTENLGYILAVGSTGPNNSKTELFKVRDKTWSTHEDYPYLPTITRYAAVHTGESFYIVGGSTNKSSAEGDQDRIARFSQRTKRWTDIGKLAVARRGHGAVFDRDNLVVFGGFEQLSIETCKLVNETFNCTLTEQLANRAFTNYAFYSELSLVTGSFCDT